MAKSILRMPRTDKHLRLFELIRQGNLAEETTKRVGTPQTGGPEQHALRQKAEASIQP